ncbi:MAG: DHA2 family efflux MFS transporter permease subunit, partial [Cyanobacteria bacterium REEB65]|nr:DHA2 family efflux MFS transporter permease subunit [Cyanobacteria bacterium REEB65]
MASNAGALAPRGAMRQAGSASAAKADDGYKWRAATVVILGMFIVILDSSIVNVALPHMMAAFGANLEQIEWVSTGYMLSSAVMMPTTGFLGDRFGRKKIYLACIALFTIVSMMCGAAWSTGSLILFRILQGVAGGAIQPIGQAILFEAFPPQERGLSMGLVGIGAMLAPVLGPTLGGYLVDALNWRWIFYVNLPVGIVATFLGMALLRESNMRQVKFDAIGFSLMATFLTTCLLAVSDGNRYGWDSPYILGLFVVAIVTFCLFLVVALWRAEPIVNLRLYKYSVYTAGTITGIVLGVGLFGGVFLLPVFLQNLMGFDAIQTGLIMAPAGLVAGVVMPISGALITRISPRIQLTIGMVLMAASMFLQAQMTPATGVFDIIWWSALRSVGMGMAFPAMNQ